MTFHEKSCSSTYQREKNIIRHQRALYIHIPRKAERGQLTPLNYLSTSSMNVKHIIGVVIQVELVILLQSIPSVCRSMSYCYHDMGCRQGPDTCHILRLYSLAQTMAVLFSYITVLLHLARYSLYSKLLCCLTLLVTWHHFQLLMLSVFGKETFFLKFYSSKHSPR